MTIATESCTDCANTTQTTNASSSQGVTYDQGQGIKDKVVLTGPLSELLAQQLNVIFKKTDIAEQSGESTEPDVPEIVQLEATRESMVTDLAIQEAIKETTKDAENSVVLSQFDFQDVSEHLRQVYESPEQEKEYNHNTIALVVGTPEQILKEDLKAYKDIPGVKIVDVLIVDPGKDAHYEFQYHDNQPKVHRIFAESKKPTEKASDHISLESMRSILDTEASIVSDNLYMYLEERHAARR